MIKINILLYTNIHICYTKISWIPQIVEDSNTYICHEYKKRWRFFSFKFDFWEFLTKIKFGFLWVSRLNRNTNCQALKSSEIFLKIGTNVIVGVPNRRRDSISV